MSSEPTATESAAAQSIAGQPQSSDDLKVKQDGGVEQVKEGEQKEGGDKTVFDDAGNFNVKVSLGLKSCSVADWYGGVRFRMLMQSFSLTISSRLLFFYVQFHFIPTQINHPQIQSLAGSWTRSTPSSPNGPCTSPRPT
jgi:hypothetical protein